MQITLQEFQQLFPAFCRDADCASFLVDILEPMQLRADEELITQGELSDTMYLVWSGRLIQSTESNQIKIDLGETLPGRWVGELGFIDPDDAAATVSAVEDSVVLALTQKALDTLLERSPNEVSIILRVLSLDLAERLRVTRKHVLSKIKEDEYALSEKPEKPDEGWFSRIGRRIVGHVGEGS